MRAPTGLRGVEGGRARPVGALASTCPSWELAGKRGSWEPPRAGWQAWRGSCLRTAGGRRDAPGGLVQVCICVGKRRGAGFQNSVAEEALRGGWTPRGS